MVHFLDMQEVHEIDVSGIVTYCEKWPHNYVHIILVPFN